MHDYEVPYETYQVPYKAEHIPSLPDKVRPIVRYRPEDFGYLIAFPEGRVGMFKPSVKPLLMAGSCYEECREHRVTHLSVDTQFSFSAPLMVWVELTRECNLRCPHCFVDAGDKREVEMPTERIMKLLDEWAAMGVFCVVITGGEPSIQPDFIEIVNRAYDLGFVVAIASNGMRLDEEILSQIPQDDVIISISLDGIHGAGASCGEDDFTAISRKAREIRDFGFNTSLMTTTTHENVGELKKFVDFAADNSISLRSVPFIPAGRGKFYQEGLQNRVEDIEKAAQFWIAEERWEKIKDKELGICSGKIFDFLFTMVYCMHRCMSGRGLCYITSDGTVYPCSNCSSGQLFPGGNLLEKDFANIWGDDTWGVRQFTWDVFLEKTCKGCPINEADHFCTGRCPSSAFLYTGKTNGCGVSEFQRESILRREELLREFLMEEEARERYDEKIDFEYMSTGDIVPPQPPSAEELVTLKGSST